MSVFGWSYPPGCSGPPEYPDPSPLREKVWELLENGQTPQYLIDLVDRVIEQLEGDASRECETCLAKQLEDEARFAREMQL